MLARDRAGKWVVIELKRHRAAEKVIGQLLRYRAFVVAPKPDRHLIRAAEGAQPTPIVVFQFTVYGRGKRLYPS